MVSPLMHARHVVFTWPLASCHKPAGQRPHVRVAVVEHADVASWPGPHVAHARQDDGPFAARFGTRASKLTTFEVLTYPPPRNCRVQIRIKLPVGIEWYLYFNSLCALR